MKALFEIGQGLWLYEVYKGVYGLASLGVTRLHEIQQVSTPVAEVMIQSREDRQ